MENLQECFGNETMVKNFQYAYRATIFRKWGFRMLHGQNSFWNFNKCQPVKVFIRDNLSKMIEFDMQY